MIKMENCINCGKDLSLNQIKEGNKFCSKSCAATYNNKLRRGYKQETRKCLYCGKEFTVEKSNPKKYCNNSCGTRYINENHLAKPRKPKVKFIKPTMTDVEAILLFEKFLWS